MSMKYTAMSATVLDRSIKKLGLKPPSQKTIPAKAKVVKAYFEEKTSADDMSQCTNCKGDSDVNFEECPYCGDKDVTDGSSAITTSGTDITNDAPPPTKELDEAVVRFKDLKKNTERSIWELGVEVARIHDGDLWKTRMLGADPQYKTFKAFCAAELGISHVHAYSLIDISKKFTREQVEKYGVSKLNIVAQLPPDQRESALQTAANTSKRELAGQISGKGTNKPTPDKLTIMTRADAKVKLTMLGAGSSTKGKPAKSLADDPWVEEEHENGVISRYVVKLDPKKQQVILVITRRRA